MRLAEEEGGGDAGVVQLVGRRGDDDDDDGFLPVRMGTIRARFPTIRSQVRYDDAPRIFIERRRKAAINGESETTLQSPKLVIPSRGRISPTTRLSLAASGDESSQPPKKSKKKSSNNKSKQQSPGNKTRRRPKQKSSAAAAAPSASDAAAQNQKNKQELFEAVGAQMKQRSSSRSSNNDDETERDSSNRLLDRINPFKAGQSLRQTIDTALRGSTSTILPGSSHNKQQSIYYLDDRFMETAASSSSTTTTRSQHADQEPSYVPEVLVVGATGEVGRLVVQQLLRSGRVRVRVLVRDLYTRTLNLLGTGVTYCPGDLGNVDGALEYAVTDVDKIVFCAAAPRPDEEQFRERFARFRDENLVAAHKTQHDRPAAALRTTTDRLVVVVFLRPGVGAVGRRVAGAGGPRRAGGPGGHAEPGARLPERAARRLRHLAGRQAVALQV